MPEGKNPDFLIHGKLFEGKSLFGLKNYEREYARHAILNHIKKAKKQADNIILEIPAMVEREIIHSAINGYLAQCKKDKEIWVIWKNKLLKYKKR